MTHLVIAALVAVLVMASVTATGAMLFSSKVK